MQMTQQFSFKHTRGNAAEGISRWGPLKAKSGTLSLWVAGPLFHHKALRERQTKDLETQKKRSRLPESIVTIITRSAGIDFQN